MKEYGNVIKCKKCGETKSVNEYYFKGRFYRQKVCKKCFKEWSAERYEKRVVHHTRKNVQDLLEYAKKWNLEHPTVKPMSAMVYEELTMPKAIQTYN